MGSERWFSTPVSPRVLISVLACIWAACYQVVLLPKWRIDEAADYWPVEDFRNDKCTTIRELAGCEDQFLDTVSGLSYLACNELQARGSWFPPMHRFDIDQIPQPWSPQSSPGSLMLYDTKSGRITRLSIEGLPINATGLASTHGIDAYIDRTVSGPPLVTLFVVNHLPPSNLAQVRDSGADSVIEIFDTRLGSHTVHHRQSIRHELLVTPNGMLALGPNSFYATNDHAHKTSWWARHWLNPRGSSVVFCHLNKCNVSARLPLPNGIGKGPNGVIYVASTQTGMVYIYNEQLDHSLVLVDTVSVNRALDNIYVTEEGVLVLAAVPSLTKLKGLGSSHSSASPETYLAPTEVYTMRNGTQAEESRYVVEKIFADSGHYAGSATNAILYNDELFMASLFGYAARCRMKN